jgi:hypothetical protein
MTAPSPLISETLAALDLPCCSFPRPTPCGRTAGIRLKATFRAAPKSADGTVP